MTHILTIGKQRGIRQLANDAGIFTMAAEDQRGSMRKMLKASAPTEVAPSLLTEVKLDIARALSPHASAILLDPEYGAAQAISSGALRGSCGLLVSLEDTDYEQHGDDRRAKILHDWSVAKIKQMGASAVKLLAYYRPDRGEGTTYQQDLIASIGEDCKRHDIAFVLEPVGYPVDGMQVDSAEYAAIKPQIVIDTARQLSGLGVDVYKAEFPANSKFEHDEKKLADFCRDLNAECQVPWVVLSAGVDIDIFRDQVRIACQAGASGFLAGRAIWKNAVALPAAERRTFLQSEGVANLTGLVETANKYATPWSTRSNPGLVMPVIDDTWFSA